MKQGETATENVRIVRIDEDRVHLFATKSKQEFWPTCAEFLNRQ